MPTNRRPAAGEASERDGAEDPKTDKSDKTHKTDKTDKTDRPGFDLGGSSGKTSAGRGLGLGTDAKDDKEEWKLPRNK